jgi:RecA/RadA recombinase
LSVLEKMKSFKLKEGGVKASTFEQTDFFKKENVVAPMLVPIINVAMSAKFDGGLPSGISMFAGDSKTFKTLLSLLCVKAYLEKYDDGIAIIYDSEFGITPEYLSSIGIDLNRVLHEPIDTIESLKFNMYKRLKDVESGDHVIFMIDSLGLLPSLKEAEDAEKENSVADMTRAKELKSFYRLVTGSLSIKNIPCVIVNHIYQEMKSYGKNVVTGGKGSVLAPNQIFIITKEKETDGSGKEKEIVGFTFNLRVHKSRFVKEDSVFSFTVKYETGLEYSSGLLDEALEAKLIKRTGNSYSVDGELEKYSREEIENNTKIWKKMIKNKEFEEFIKNKYLIKGSILGEDFETNEDDTI